jgi:hypothetical protein
MHNLKLLLIGSLLILLPACSTITSKNFLPEPPSRINSCGVLFEYPKELQDRVAAKYPSLDADTKKLIDDYKTTRDTIRACEDAKPMD